MPYKIIVYNIDGTPETEDLDGQNFYKNRLIEAGERFNRQETVWNRRISFWNIELQGDESTYGKLWVKSLSPTDAKTKYEKLANFASEQMLNYYYQFVDEADENQPLECELTTELGTEKIEIFQNMVRFTIADYFNAYSDNNNVKIQVIEGSKLDNEKLLDNMPFKLSFKEGSRFFHHLHEDKVSFFVDVDYPQHYFVQNGNKWDRISLKDAGLNIETTEVLYWRTDDGEINTGLLTVPSRRTKGSGGGGGAMRADKVGEVEYLWKGNLAYGLALGLEHGSFLEERERIDPSFINTTPYISGENHNASPINYYKKFADILLSPKKNHPKPLLEPVPPRTFQFNSYASLKRSKFFYSTDFFKLRQKGKSTSPGWMGLQLHHKNSRDRDDAGPVMGKALSQYQTFAQLYETWRNNDANIPLHTTSVSATNFTDFILSDGQIQEQPYKQWNDQLREQWNDLRGENFEKRNITPPDPRQNGIYKDWDQRRTDQEWCHLYGHGDGGSEEWGNFVAGSKHCNTVQLAIESGQRKNQIQGLRVKVSAYLFERFLFKEPTYFSEVIGYLQERLFEPTLTAAIEELGQALGIVDAMEDPELNSDIFGQILTDKIQFYNLNKEQRSNLLKKFCVPLPIAKMIHYKVYYRNNIAFDYFFDAQSESFDYNEFKILQNLVIRSIAITRTRIGGGTDDDEAVENYKASMIGKLLSMKNKGLISEDSYNRLLNSHYIDFDIEIDGEDDEDMDSSDDENSEEDDAMEAPQKRRAKKRRGRTMRGAKARKKEELDNSSSEEEDEEEERKRNDFDIAFSHPI